MVESNKESFADNLLKNKQKISKLVNAKRNGVFYFKRVIKNFLFRKISKNSSRLFLKGNDYISQRPITEGLWELSLTSFITSFAEKGYSDFFIDIGANIGLISCQNGIFFKKVICFEPNPLCVQILKVNLEISLPPDIFTIYEYGLGEESGTFNLYIPKHNWGGAFIDNDSNSYSKELLFLKDSSAKGNLDNYSVQKVRIESTNQSFDEVFRDLKSKGLRKGVIKLDVEGCELTILKGIAKELPSDFSLYVIFENLNKNFDFQLLTEQFPKRELKIYKLERSIFSQISSNTMKFLYLIMGKSDKDLLVPLTKDNSVIGDIVLDLTNENPHQ